MGICSIIASPRKFRLAVIRNTGLAFRHPACITGRGESLRRRARRSTMTVGRMSRRALLGSAAAVALVRPSWAAEPGDPIRKLVIVCAAQASDPQEFQAAQLLAQAWRQLGLDIEVRGMPRPQLSALVWNTREKWDMTMWRMV